MSFAGPYDPMLALALKKASERGAILIAAVGNAGPKSPPLYPAAGPARDRGDGDRRERQALPGRKYRRAGRGRGALASTSWFRRRPAAYQ
jgi:subtilisin family serine protease